MDLGLGSLLSGVANGISSIFTARENRKAQREANSANMELAKYQNEANVNLWREQNEASIKQWERNNKYNTPEAQLARYRDAGLNPMLIYGSGSSVAGNSSSPANIGSAPHLERAEMKPVTMPNIPFGDYIGDAYRLYMQQKQLNQSLDVAKAQAENTRVDSALKKVRTLRETTENNLASLNYNIKSKAEKNIVDSYRFANDKVLSEIDLNDANASNSRWRTSEIQNMLQARFDLTNAQTDYYYAMIDHASVDIALKWLKLRFDEETFDDRKNQIAATLAGSLVKNEYGDIILSRERFETNYEKQFGHKPSANLWMSVFDLIALGATNPENRNEKYR